MTRLTLTPEILLTLLERIPEGFIHSSVLLQRFRKLDRKTLVGLASERVRMVDDHFVLDSVTDAQFGLLRPWARPDLPPIRGDGEPIGTSIAQLRQDRDSGPKLRLTAQEKAALQAIHESGLAWLSEHSLDDKHVQRIESAGLARRLEGVLYDPLAVSERSAAEAIRRRRLEQLQEQVNALLGGRAGMTAPQNEIVAVVGEDGLRELLGVGGLSRFSVPLKRPPYSVTWVRLKSGDFQAAQAAALDATAIREDDWAALLPEAGEVERPRHKPAETGPRAQVLARTYTITTAARRMNLHTETVEAALEKALLSSFVDPEQVRRIPAQQVEQCLADATALNALWDIEAVRGREIALVLDVDAKRVSRRLHKAGLRSSRAPWGRVKGRWGLPATLPEFRAVLAEKLRIVQEERDAQLAAERERELAERARRVALRERLVASFPTWQHDGRTDQHLVLHIGPPNSGKTHDAMQALAVATSGWYLAPLRLLAFEVFERLNRMGVRCSLLTGEEHIPVDGATVTAATIEMFNPARSGECVVIDEAQMLADADRGWAWTRALMETQSSIIHVLAPPSAKALIERMASAAAIPLSVVRHERLAPIKVAERPWRLKELPERTILVAFSRAAVLELKTTLEGWRREVSVVYGNLPPEVRRKQADRFADGQTEVCIATDAVGMGLNLPADNVCFYEVRKFDGRSVRPLSPGEVQQIGGRAGRYGLSREGEVGALTREALDLVRRQFYAQPAALTHARVAPTVTDLEMIPGTLSERLAEWAVLKSIPDGLRGAIEVADLEERVELAKMLSCNDEAILGLAASYQLVNAPARQNSRVYWQACARAIIDGQPLPMPPNASVHVVDSEDLDRLETLIAQADIYLWLSQRREFEHTAPDTQDVRYMRTEWSEAIDRALLRRLRAKPRQTVSEPS